MSDKPKLIRPTMTSPGIVEHLDKASDAMGHDTAQIRMVNAIEPHNKIIVNNPCQSASGEEIALDVGSEVVITVTEGTIPKAS